MRKLGLTLFLAGSAFAIGLGAGAGGGYTLPFEEGADGAALAGGKVLVGVMPALKVEVDFLYYLHDEARLTSYFGARYGFPVEPLTIYVNGGGSYPIIVPDVTIPDPNNPGQTITEAGAKDFGIFVGGGIEYPFTEKIALDVNPRFNYVLSDPATKSTDIFAGVNFYFM